MSVIDIDTAIEHLRAEDDDRALIQAFLDGAEGSACDYMSRNVYVDSAALQDAQLESLNVRKNAWTAYRAAVEAARLVSDWDEQESAISDAKRALSLSLFAAEKMARGVVLNPQIQAACLLILGHLYTNREDVVAGSGTMTAIELPLGSQYLLAPHRVGMGV